jgi:asparagine synthase (glutamine-hydrolysing)
MCGIAGMAGRPLPGAGSEAVIRRMLDRQKHRGPDGRQIWVVPGGSAGLGHDRLAIIDLAGGVQPIANEDGTIVAVVNGEIYNHMALRRRLEGRHTFRTRSDSEVVLHLFEEEGPDFVRHLDGMFAIALYSTVHGLLLARDPLGIKPLYYGHDAAGNLLFASEIKALAPEVPAVNELPPGTVLPGGAGEPEPYYSLPHPTHELADAEEAADLLDHLLARAVEKRLMADVPLGCFLSGGLDSSLITAMAARLAGERLHTFSVGLEGSADIDNARRVAAYLGTEHHERVLTPAEVIEAVPQVIDLLESCDPALVRSAVPTMYVAQLASAYVKVALSGEGADELFAGYHYLDAFSDEALDDELLLMTGAMHNLNFQRADRMTMAHGLEARVPFMDLAMVEAAFRTAPALKRSGGEGKWILRKVAERYLPVDIVWRTKEKFAIGTGIGPLLEQHAEEQVPAPAGWAAEAWWYWTEFRRRYGRNDLVDGMGRSRSLNPGQFVGRQ